MSNKEEFAEPGCCAGSCICKKKEEARTLFNWAIAKEDECEEEDEEEDESCPEDSEASKPENGEADEGDDKDAEKSEKEKKNGKASCPVCYYRESLKEHRWRLKQEPLVSDRPDFTEASTTVGRGVVQLEAGYTYFRNRDVLGGRSSGHSYPEILFRIGLFADWFELRIAQNFANERNVIDEQLSATFGGAEDLVVGIKLALTEQEKYLPEMAIIMEMQVPTGHEAFSGNEVLPGMNFLYSWDIIEDFLSLGCSTLGSRTVDDEGHYFVEFAQSASLGYTLTDKVGAYTEWFAFFPTGSIDPGVGPAYYFDGGFTYLVNNNFQLDIRAGVGLNRHADDFFAGSGFVVRY